jgi:hypothetical protein
VLGYHYGKQNALALWNSGPAFGMDANMLLAWHKYGGGKELLAKLYASIGITTVQSFLYGPMATQPLGWFKKPVTKPEDIKGLKFRTNGLAIDVFTAMGAAVNALPGGEIVPAMDRGLLDAAEFNNATSDRLLGFPDVAKVCMLQSYHQSAETFEIMFNKPKYDALPADEGDHRTRRASRLGRHVVEGDRPLLQGLHRAADQGQGQVLQDAGRRCCRSSSRCGTRSWRRSRPKTRCSRKSPPRSAPSPSARCSGRGRLRQPAHGGQPLLRRQEGRPAKKA